VTNQPEEVKFDNPIITYLKKQVDALFIYDLDNYSDAFIINNANNLINSSEKTIVYIDAMPEGDFKNLMPLLTNSLDNPDHLQFILQGNNPRLEKILSILTYIKIQENTPIKQSIEAIIKQFF